MENTSKTYSLTNTSFRNTINHNKTYSVSNILHYIIFNSVCPSTEKHHSETKLLFSK